MYNANLIMQEEKNKQEYKTDALRILNQQNTTHQFQERQNGKLSQMTMPKHPFNT
jgi:hypothetical protein